MAPRTPNASICIPVWHPEPDHLRAVVASALAQEADDVEVVVSSAATEVEHVRSVLGSLLGGVRFVEQPDGLTMVEHWNAVLDEASAPVVVLPGQDDVLRPSMVATHLACHGDPTVVLCASGASLVDEDGGTLAVRRGAVAARARLVGPGQRRLAHPELVEIVLRDGNVVGAPSQVSFRAADAGALGGFDGRYEHAADLDLWLRLATRGDVVVLGTVLGTRRVHRGAATRRHQAQGVAADDRTRLLADHGDGLDAGAVVAAEAARVRWSLADALRAVLRRDGGSARRHVGDVGRAARRSLGCWRLARRERRSVRRPARR